MNVGIIGCGLIGRKRAAALAAFPKDKLIAVCDVDGERASALAKDFHCESETEWRHLTQRKDIDVIINSSINEVLEEITVGALEQGKHVLCEKPLGRNAAEAQRMVDAAQQNNAMLKTGFNHIFHPALWKAKELVDARAIGSLLSIRARYGHGSRQGMEKEWRSSKKLCGGGELLDQGVHVIDLIRWFAGEIEQVYSKVETKFWDIEVEDNAFAILTCKNNVTAMFHVSWTNWRNIFSFELFGSDGYLVVNGLGGSYGPETLEWGKRKQEGGRPDIKLFEYPPSDISWEMEWKEFRMAIEEKRQPLKNGTDGLRANQVVEAMYESHRLNVPITLTFK
jgi:predicted dehydrogenase